MELASYTIRSARTAHPDPVVIAPIGDIQWTGERGGTALDLLRRHIDRCMKLKAWFVGLGDYIDFASPSNRQRLRAAALYDTAEDVIDDAALELTQGIYEKALKPTKGRWLGLVHGHHYTQLKTGETTDQRLCQLLDARFLGTCAFVRLLFQAGGSRAGITLFVHHGCGGGMKSSAPLNKLENLLPYWDADIFLLGHMTKQAGAPINRISARWHGNGGPDLVHRKILLVGCGGFSKAYDLNARQGRVPMDGYVGQRLLNPASLGAPIVKVVPAFRDSGREWAPEITVEL